MIIHNIIALIIRHKVSINFIRSFKSAFQGGLMLNLRMQAVLGTLLLFLIGGCGNGLKGDYDLELDQLYDLFEIPTYMGEGGSIIGNGEAVEGLIKISRKGPSFKLSPINFNLIPEDTYVKVVSEIRYDGGRLRIVELELRFPEDSKVDMMTLYEEYNYSTPGEDPSGGDLNSTKPVPEGGPYAFVKVDYRRKVVFEKFSVKVAGGKEYYEDPARTDFKFNDETKGNQDGLSKIVTQGSFTGGVGNFTRIAYYDGGKIGSDVRSYAKSDTGEVTGNLSGTSADGIIVMGDFTIQTANTTCLLDDTGSIDYTVNYPPEHSTERKKETVHADIAVSGVYDGTFMLENNDGSNLNKTFHRVITRPASCDERIIRDTADLTGTNYAGETMEINEVRTRDLTHIYGHILGPEGKETKIDQYRVSGVAIYR
jgi:hypothetical protein